MGGAAPDAIGEDGDEGTDRLERREGEELDESASIQVEHGKMVEFVLNVRQAQRGRALPLWCPGLVTAIHKRQSNLTLPLPLPLPLTRPARRATCGRGAQLPSATIARAGTSK